MRQVADKTSKYLKAVAAYHKQSQRIRPPMQQVRFSALFHATREEEWLAWMGQGLSPSGAYQAWLMKHGD